MAIFGNAGGYGYNPLNPRAQMMTEDLNTRPAMDPMYSGVLNNGYGGASTPAEVAAAGLRRDDVPGGIFGGVAGALPGASTNFQQSASFLGGAGGPNVAGNAQMQPAQMPTGGSPSNDQYINTGTSWIRNPDFNPLAELRGGALQAYQKDNSIANKMGYQENGVGNAGYDPALLRSTRQQMDMAGGVGGFFGNTMNSTQEQLNLQNALNGIAPDPFAGQNLNDASVQFQMRQYMANNPGYVPINTYKGEAPRLPGEINQDTGMRTMEGVSGQNPWITNKGFGQQMPWQGQQQQQAPYQAPQAQQAQNLQPFQQTSAYQNAMSQNWSSPIQQPQNNFGNQNAQQQGQPSFGNPQNNFGGGQSQGFGNLQNNFQSMYQNQQPQQQQSFGQNGFGGNRFGLKSAYGTR